MTQPLEHPKTQDPSTGQPKAWNVVLIDDQDHSYGYVINMMQKLFFVSPEKAFAIAKTVDTSGRAICVTTHKEYAEFKRDQIHAYGPDPSMSRSVGSMTAIIEPCQGGGEDDGRA